MLEFKNKEGKIVMTESTESGKVTMLSEELKQKSVSIPDEVVDETDKEETESKE